MSILLKLMEKDGQREWVNSMEYFDRIRAGWDMVQGTTEETYRLVEEKDQE